MQEVKVAIGRIYNADACSIVGGKEIRFNFKFDGFEIIVVAGPNLHHTILGLDFNSSTVKDISGSTKPSRRVVQNFPSSEVFPADFYVELVLNKILLLNNKLADAFNNGDIKSRNTIFQILNEKKEDYARALDFVAGAMGLRLHKQLVSDPILEQQYIYKREKGYAIQSSLSFNVTDRFEWDKDGELSNNMLRVIPKHLSKEKWKNTGEILVWMLRAWTSKDMMMKFLSFMTALELVIPALNKSEKEVFEKRKKKLISLISKHADSFDKEYFLELINKINAPSAINLRFAKWATKIQLGSYEVDIATFKKYNKVRNFLLHAGSPSSDDKISKELKEIRDLEYLAEKYVSYALFGDANVYKRNISKIVS